MTIYLTKNNVLSLHRKIIKQGGGSPFLRDEAGLESAVALPKQTFDKVPLYPTLAAKAGILAYSLAKNHAFVDGNKRIAHIAAETFLFANGYELQGSPDEQENVILRVTSGEMKLSELIEWFGTHIIENS